MTVNSHLTEVANRAIIRDKEKKSIQKSIATLQIRLNSYFSGELSRHFLFGSYTRDTILPRAMDQRSDVDYMIVFKDSIYQPQTYLDKLKRFVNKYYTSSEIAQSNPTIILSLEHIKFDLVPAIETCYGELKIPAKVSSSGHWIQTNPNHFNETLSRVNSLNKNFIKPTIRLAKYWNAKNGYIFESFELEKMLANHSYWRVGGLWGVGQQKDYFFDVMDSLKLGWGAAQYKVNAINCAKQLVRETRDLLKRGMEADAESKIRRLIPPTVTGFNPLRSWVKG